MTATLVLEPVLDLKAAEPLKVALLEHQGDALSLDASHVQRLGGLCLQLLLAARRSWAEAGQTLVVTPRSAAFDDAVALFGARGRFDQDDLGEGA
jgi:chemotaxis protein CheX